MTGFTEREALKVLIVEDEPFMRKTIRMMLRAVGRFLVEDADDGDTALAMLATFRPDIILCDISMPHMSGLEFVERLRNHRQADLRLIPILMLTGKADAATILDAARLKISGYLVKPVSPKQLGTHIDAIFPTRQHAPVR